MQSVKCPKCQRAYALTPQNAGKAFRCECGQAFTTPVPNAAKMQQPAMAAVGQPMGPPPANPYAAAGMPGQAGPYANPQNPYMQNQQPPMQQQPAPFVGEKMNPYAYSPWAYAPPKMKVKTKTLNQKGEAVDEGENTNRFQSGSAHLVGGIVIGGIGIALTVGSYMSSEDGTFSIFYGALIWGALHLIAGVVLMCMGKF